jgi:hypothetical protein
MPPTSLAHPASQLRKYCIGRKPDYWLVCPRRTIIDAMTLVNPEPEVVEPPEEATGPERPSSQTPSRADSIREYFEPLFAGTGGIDSWLVEGTPQEVFDRLGHLPDEPLSKSQLSQLLILSHEAGPSEGFFRYYWLSTPAHTYNVTNHGATGDPFDQAWIKGTEILSLAHLRWGLHRFYVDALLYFGNVRSAYRALRDMSEQGLVEFFAHRRIDTEGLRRRGPALDLRPIAKDDRYLVAEYACKSFGSDAGGSELEQAVLQAYRARLEAGGSQIVSVDELLRGKFIEDKFPGRQQQFTFSADDILQEQVGSEEELKSRLAPISQRFHRARGAALENTRLYLSMVEGLDVYVATSMRTREHFRRMATFCEEVFSQSELKSLHIRYFDPTMSAAEGHVDKGLIECLMVDAAKILVYYAGDRESLGKDFEAAMALSRGKPVIVYCDDEEKEHLYRDVHPLMRLIEFDTGVPVGAMVTNNIESVGTLIRRLLDNNMEYDLSKTALGSLHLTERLTGSLVRLQTHDKLLQETFWNYYHRRGVLE